MKLLLINPNTTQAMTDMALVVARAVAGPGTELLAVSGSFGPAVIGSRAECALAQHSVLQLAAEHASGCDAVVLAVSLDSALWACRELLSVPVIGMTEAGLLMGCNVATRIGIVTYGRRMGPFYRELAESYGLGVRLAGVATIDVTPQASLAAPHQTHAAVLAAARRLIDHDGAEAVLLAGAAMATMAGTLQAQLDVPLLDGIACAVVLAEAQVALALPKARCGSVSPTGGRTVHGVSPQLSEVFAGRL
jgi:allantoin racemase